MKLYEVPKNTWVKTKQENNIVFFYHIDGMYSYCEDEKGNIVHLAAWTEVEILDKT